MNPFPTLIPYNVPTLSGDELQYVTACLKNRKFSGDGPFTAECSRLLKHLTACPNVLMTTSCTDALEMAALLLDIAPGDEVISPSFTFVSAANAFALRGAKIVFVDIDPKTMNVNSSNIEKAITPRTKAISIVHYAGVSCDMDAIQNISKKYKIPIVEDAAQGLMSFFKGQHVGTIGSLGCLSFHETKNYNCGEGGALLINDPTLVKRAEIIREKGTNRSQHARGEVSKYNWISLGSSFLMSDVNAAFLCAQLNRADEINQKRLVIWNSYFESFQSLKNDGLVDIPYIPDYAKHNGHIFYLKLRNENQRNNFIDFMKQMNILTVFHYVPLHSAPAGLIYARFHGEDRHTSSESSRLVRLPIFHSMSTEQLQFVINCVINFFRNSL